MIISDIKDYSDDLVKVQDHPEFPELPQIEYNEPEKNKWKQYHDPPKNKAWKYHKAEEKKEWKIDAEPDKSYSKPDKKRQWPKPEKKHWKYEENEKKFEKMARVNPDSKLDGIDLPQSPQKGGKQKEWSYRRIRDLIALLHVGLFEYADRLSSYIAYSSEFKGKLVKCTKRLTVLSLDLKNLVQDKIKLQELLKDLSSKYNMLEHSLKQAGDINQDNKDTIEKIRVNRDKCIRTIDNRNEVVTSLRNQNSELRRHLATLRSRFGK